MTSEEPVKEKWSDHLKEFAKKNDTTYRLAMSNADAKLEWAVKRAKQPKKEKAKKEKTEPKPKKEKTPPKPKKDTAEPKPKKETKPKKSVKEKKELAEKLK